MQAIPYPSRAAPSFMWHLMGLLWKENTLACQPHSPVFTRAGDFCSCDDLSIQEKQACDGRVCVVESLSVFCKTSKMKKDTAPAYKPLS